MSPFPSEKSWQYLHGKTVRQGHRGVNICKNLLPIRTLSRRCLAAANRIQKTCYSIWNLQLDAYLWTRRKESNKQTVFVFSIININCKSPKINYFSVALAFLFYVNQPKQSHLMKSLAAILTSVSIKFPLVHKRIWVGCIIICLASLAETQVSAHQSRRVKILSVRHGKNVCLEKRLCSFHCPFLYKLNGIQ